MTSSNKLSETNFKLSHFCCRKDVSDPPDLPDLPDPEPPPHPIDFRLGPVTNKESKFRCDRCVRSFKSVFIYKEFAVIGKSFSAAVEFQCFRSAKKVQRFKSDFTDREEPHCCRAQCFFSAIEVLQCFSSASEVIQCLQSATEVLSCAWDVLEMRLAVLEMCFRCT